VRCRSPQRYYLRNRRDRRRGSAEPPTLRRPGLRQGQVIVRLAYGFIVSISVSSFCGSSLAPFPLRQAECEAVAHYRTSPAKTADWTRYFSMLSGRPRSARPVPGRARPRAACNAARARCRWRPAAVCGRVFPSAVVIAPPHGGSRMRADGRASIRSSAAAGGAVVRRHWPR